MAMKKMVAKRTLDAALLARSLGHGINILEVTGDRELRRYFIKCKCGYESRTRPTRRAAQAVAVWHTMDVAEKAIASGVSPIDSSKVVVEPPQAFQTGPASPGAA